jgi:uncharacterized protein (DUF58 family)
MPQTLLRALEVTISRRVEGLLAGDYRSTLHGSGTELAQIRPYEVGDDVRRIDWNVTARTSEPHVRVDLAERALVTWIVLDASASMHFGTADRRKADVAEGAAMAIGHIATRRGNRLGIITFGGSVERVVPPRQGRVGLLGVMTTLHSHDEAAAGSGSLARALRRTGGMARQKALVVIISDFRGALDWRRELLQLAARHDVVAVEVRDPREQELPEAGELWLVDPESGRQLRIDTRDGPLRARFAQAAERERQQVAATIASAGARHVVLSTEGDWLRWLALFLRRRAA